MRWRLALIIFLGSFFTLTSAQASDFRSRANTWEFTVQMRWLDSQSFGADGGTQISTNADIGWGFGFGYNFNDHLGLDFEIAWNSPSYDAAIVTDAPSVVNRTGELQTSSFQVNLIYNFLPGAVTPYVSAGIGSAYIDTNIAAGPPGTSCWWDPWYGYICYGYQPTYADYRFSYGGAVGLRWDMSRQIFLRAAIGTVWIDMPSGGDQSFTNGRLEIGFSY